MNRQRQQTYPDQDEREYGRNSPAGSRTVGNTDYGRGWTGAPTDRYRDQRTATERQREAYLPTSGGDGSIGYGGGGYRGEAFDEDRYQSRDDDRWRHGSPRQRDPGEPERGRQYGPRDEHAGEHDFGPELFGIGGGSERGRYGGTWARDADEDFYDEASALRRGFGQRRKTWRNDWESDHAQPPQRTTPSESPGYGTSGSWGEWREVARDRKGPRGYTRSDERIREFICERLTQLHQLDVSDVGVTVTDGHVMLDGTVPERHMKYRIEDTADSCWGVKDVENHIRVQARGMGDTSQREGSPHTTYGIESSGGGFTSSRGQDQQGTPSATGARGPDTTAPAATTGRGRKG